MREFLRGYVSVYLLGLLSACGAPTLEHSISGTITGAPPGIEVTLISEDWFSGSTDFDSTTTDANGYYSFRTLLLNDSYTIKPVASGYAFSPPSRTVTSHVDVAGQDFTATMRTNSISGIVVGPY